MLEPFQWEYLSSITAISRFFFVSIWILFLFYLISTFLILSGRQFIFSLLWFCFGFRTVSSLTAVPTSKNLHRFVMFATSPYISQVFHFQFSLTVSLTSFTFLGGIPAPVCLRFLLPLLERVFFLFVLVTLSPTWLSFYFSRTAKLVPQGTKDLFFFISGFSQTRPAKNRELLVWACIQQWREGNTGSCRLSRMKTMYGRVPKSSSFLLLLSSCQSVVISCLI